MPSLPWCVFEQLLLAFTRSLPSQMQYHCGLCEERFCLGRPAPQNCADCVKSSLRFCADACQTQAIPYVKAA